MFKDLLSFTFLNQFLPSTILFLTGLVWVCFLVLRFCRPQSIYVKVLYLKYEPIWKTHQWPQDWKRSVLIPIPKKGNAKECSNYRGPFPSLPAALTPVSRCCRNLVRPFPAPLFLAGSSPRHPPASCGALLGAFPRGLF